jgi:hypothetical protein
MKTSTCGTYPEEFVEPKCGRTSTFHYVPMRNRRKVSHLTIPEHCCCSGLLYSHANNF